MGGIFFVGKSLDVIRLSFFLGEQLFVKKFFKKVLTILALYVRINHQKKGSKKLWQQKKSQMKK